jgi:hypothetical protein
VVGIGIFLLLIPGVLREGFNGIAGVPVPAGTATTFHHPMGIIPLHSLGKRQLHVLIALIYWLFNARPFFGASRFAK